jgi:recombination protein RecT
MSDQTAITPYDKFKTLIISDNVRSMITDASGGDVAFASRIVSNLLTVVGQRNDLLECKPESILRSACQAAALGLVLEPALGQAHLVPFNSRDGKKAQLIVGYKGYRTLALNTGRYKNLNVAPWYTGERIIEDRLTGDVQIDGDPIEPKEIAGYIGVLAEKNGGPKYYLHMTLDEIRDHAKKYSKSYNQSDSPWKNEFHAMCAKTIVRLLLVRNGTFSIGAAATLAEVEKQEEAGEVIDSTWQEREIPETEPTHENGNGKVAGGFDPVALLVDNKLSQNAYSATNLLANYVPDDVKGDAEKLTAWARIYRGWRDLDTTAEVAAEHATKGEMPL